MKKFLITIFKDGTVKHAAIVSAENKYRVLASYEKKYGKIDINESYGIEGEILE